MTVRPPAAPNRPARSSASGRPPGACAGLRTAAIAERRKLYAQKRPVIEKALVLPD